jgi:hypothetical protein
MLPPAFVSRLGPACLPSSAPRARWPKHIARIVFGTRSALSLAERIVLIPIYPIWITCRLQVPLTHPVLPV